jgi:hypothetical protein
LLPPPDAQAQSPKTTAHVDTRETRIETSP